MAIPGVLRQTRDGGSASHAAPAAAQQGDEGAAAGGSPGARRLVGLAPRWRIYAPIALAAAILSGCAAPGGDLPDLPPVRTGHYVLGAGDRIRIITFGAEQLTGEFRVGDSGDISVPLLGNVRAAGLTSRSSSTA